jgi:short-subunit dehydrogenase
MKCKNKVILLTGATGGLGQELAIALAQKQAKLVLTGRDSKKLAQLKNKINAQLGECIVVSADLTTQEGRQQIITATLKHYDTIDILINNAGHSELVCFEEQQTDAIETLFQTNLIAPILLTQSILPKMLAKGKGQIVNIGSGFGSIGFGCYSCYSASKFGLRGFSESLRRELSKTGVKITYVAPRGIRTPMNSEAFYNVAKKIGFKFDDPKKVAKLTIKAIEKNKKDYFIGFFEKLFVRINGFSPRRVDASVEKQSRQLKKFLQS